MKGLPEDARKSACYASVHAAMRRFLRKYPRVDRVGRMATLNSLLYMAFPHMWFVGFYLVDKRA